VWLNRPLDDILSSRSKVAVLRVLSDTSAPLNGREIARRAGVVPGHMYRVLRDLVSSGVVLSRDQGRAITYELTNPRSAVTRRLRELFAVEARRRREVVGGLLKAVPEIRSIILFGSEARGDASSGSDTDFLIVMDRKTKRLDERVSNACMQLAAEHQLSLSWLVTDLKELQEWQTVDDDFLQNVKAEGVTLAGRPLERLLD